MTEMAAVQQRTPTPVDPKQRTAFIESMEEEMRRVAEHLERAWYTARGSGVQWQPTGVQKRGGCERLEFHRGKRFRSRSEAEEDQQTPADAFHAA